MIKSIRYLLIVTVTLLAINVCMMLRDNTVRAQSRSTGRFKVVVFQANSNAKTLERELNDPEQQWSDVSVHLAQNSGDMSLAILKR
jgi:hypothetical protein